MRSYLGDDISPAPQGDVTNSQYLDLYNQQMSQFKSQLMDLLPGLAKSKADFDADLFRYQTQRSILDSVLNQWMSNVLPLAQNYSSANTVMNQIVGVIPNLSEDYPTTRSEGYIGSIDNLRSLLAYYGYGADIAPDDLLKIVLAQQPTNLLDVIHSLVSARHQFDIDNSLYTQLTQQNQALQAAITGWLESAKAYSDQIGTIPTYQDVVNQVQNQMTAHPISQAAVVQTPVITPAAQASPATTVNPLIYIGATILALMIAGRK